MGEAFQMLLFSLVLGAFLGRAYAQLNIWCLIHPAIPWCGECPVMAWHNQWPWTDFNRGGQAEVTFRYFSSQIHDDLTEDPRQIWSLGEDVTCEVNGPTLDIGEGNIDGVSVSITTPPTWVGARKLKLAVHGFTDNTDPTVNEKSWPKFVKAWMDKHPDTDVVLIDWSKQDGSWFTDYDWAAQVAVDVGRWLGVCLGGLKKMDKISELHVAGHSLGAHLLGKAGRTYTKWTEGQKIDRLTGLDPAGPRWVTGLVCPVIGYLAKNVLRHDSAAYMDIIHTNGGKKPSGATIWPTLGMRNPVGDIDFYPDGGQWQPGCNDLIVGGGDDKGTGCSHRRAVMYFYWSIKEPDMFPSRQCSEWDGDCKDRDGSNDGADVMMGEFVDQTRRGYWWRDIQNSCWDWDTWPSTGC